jgi:hypothetical protein
MATINIKRIILFIVWLSAILFFLSLQTSCRSVKKTNEYFASQTGLNTLKNEVSNFINTIKSEISSSLKIDFTEKLNTAIC